MPAHLENLHYDEQIIVPEIHFMARPDDRRNLLDHTVSS